MVTVHVPMDEVYRERKDATGRTWEDIIIRGLESLEKEAFANGGEEGVDCSIHGVPYEIGIKAIGKANK